MNEEILQMLNNLPDNVTHGYWERPGHTNYYSVKLSVEEVKEIILNRIKNENTLEKTRQS